VENSDAAQNFRCESGGFRPIKKLKVVKERAVAGNSTSQRPDGDQGAVKKMAPKKKATKKSKSTKKTKKKGTK
jgi:hypothetical protein